MHKKLLNHIKKRAELNLIRATTTKTLVQIFTISITAAAAIMGATAALTAAIISLFA